MLFIFTQKSRHTSDTHQESSEGRTEKSRCSYLAKTFAYLSLTDSQYTELKENFEIINASPSHTVEMERTKF